MYVAAKMWQDVMQCREQKERDNDRRRIKPVVRTAFRRTVKPDENDENESLDLTLCAAQM